MTCLMFSEEGNWGSNIETTTWGLIRESTDLHNEMRYPNADLYNGMLTYST